MVLGGSGRRVSAAGWAREGSRGEARDANAHRGRALVKHHYCFPCGVWVEEGEGERRKCDSRRPRAERQLLTQESGGELACYSRHAPTAYTTKRCARFVFIATKHLAHSWSRGVRCWKGRCLAARRCLRTTSHVPRRRRRRSVPRSCDVKVDGWRWAVRTAVFCARARARRRAFDACVLASGRHGPLGPGGV